ncbi:hypothetical protein Premu_1168 [Hallella multisaccharivorax DSM 17128]|uniref:Uncharacterized protein n=1 Tax=Hallella multisaccharivorax DSM 17128 TaxID=688246 RepID=F8N924_9BACT|nr:hypothetical protein Premu_1168 [Hallella multisaccharivorax DSM 17128]
MPYSLLSGMWRFAPQLESES